MSDSHMPRSPSYADMMSETHAELVPAMRARPMPEDERKNRDERLAYWATLPIPERLASLETAKIDIVDEQAVMHGHVLRLRADHEEGRRTVSGAVEHVNTTVRAAMQRFDEHAKASATRDAELAQRITTSIVEQNRRARKRWSLRDVATIIGIIAAAVASVVAAARSNNAPPGRERDAAVEPPPPPAIVAPAH